MARRHVWEHNNLAQKNLTIVDRAPNTWFVLPFLVAGLATTGRQRFQLELVRPSGQVPAAARRGDVLTLDLVQRKGTTPTIVGGVAVRVNVV